MTDGQQFLNFNFRLWYSAENFSVCALRLRPSMKMQLWSFTVMMFSIYSKQYWIPVYACTMYMDLLLSYFYYLILLTVIRIECMREIYYPNFRKWIWLKKKEKRLSRNNIHLWNNSKNKSIFTKGSMNKWKALKIWEHCNIGSALTWNHSNNHCWTISKGEKNSWNSY